MIEEVEGVRSFVGHGWCHRCMQQVNSRFPRYCPGPFDSHDIGASAIGQMYVGSGSADCMPRLHGPEDAQPLLGNHRP